MAAQREDEPDPKKWSGFSDYESVASRLHKGINRAVDAYAHLDSRDKQSIGITPQTAVSARSAILWATKRLSPEIKKQRHQDGLEDIHERWHEGGPDGPGFVALLEDADFRGGDVPAWLGQLVDDIVEAGWELGYLQAGRTEPADPEDDDMKISEVID